jgi:hypothetical protein
MLLIFSVPVISPVYFLRDNVKRGKKRLKIIPQLHLQPTPNRRMICRFLRTSRAMKCFLYLINPESLTQPLIFFTFLFSLFKWLKIDLPSGNQRLLTYQHWTAGIIQSFVTFTEWRFPNIESIRFCLISPRKFYLSVYCS